MGNFRSLLSVLALCGGIVAIAVSSVRVGSGAANAATSNPVASVLQVAAQDFNYATDGDMLFDDQGSILKQLDTLTTIGSAVDPIGGDQNPYGLDVARVTAGKLQAGDLVVCDFNDRANVQGTGSAIVALHPMPGSMPIHIAKDPSLLGCNELALAPDDTIWAAAFAANDNPVLAPNGQLLDPIKNGAFHRPFGEAFSPTAGPFGVAAFYESNAQSGSIVRINITRHGTLTFDVIATGFAVNHGAPGSILGPSGLQYDVKHDRLYIVDGTNNTLVAFRHVSTIPAGGIVVHGKLFSGPFAHRARLIYSGAPLNGPISSALLFDGHLVLGNTLDPNGKNLLVEVTPHGRVLDVKNVDNGIGAALFGIVATGHSAADTKVFFNDDNDNTVKVLTH